MQAIDPSVINYEPFEDAQCVTIFLFSFLFPQLLLKYYITTRNTFFNFSIILFAFQVIDPELNWM